MGSAQGKAEGDTPPSVEPLSYEEYAALQECFIHMLGGEAAALPGADDTALLAPLSGVEVRRFRGSDVRLCAQLRCVTSFRRRASASRAGRPSQPH